MGPETIQRPNGKPYRPRRIFAQVIGEEDEGVLVLGTHNIARAQGLADRVAESTVGRGFTAVDPCLGWWRDGFESGWRAWVSDEVHGRAGVLFRDVVETGPLAGLDPWAEGEGRTDGSQ
jgi:hypothetical protein